MSLFGDIMNKIFHHPVAAAAAAVAPSIPTQAPATPSASAPAPAPAMTATPAPIDVEVVLTAMAAQKGGGGNWNSSIVDLLKLLDLDSSLNARKQLAAEMNVHVGPDGSAEENIALHRAVMRKLADNGGKVPDSLKS